MSLAHALEAQGRRCWIAPRDIPAGADYPHEIVTGIQREEAFLILLTSAAVLSKHILRELELAASAGKRILPVRVGHVELNSSMTFLLAGVQWIEVTAEELWTHPERIADRILDGRGTRLRTATPVKRNRPAATWIALASVAVAGLAVAGLVKWQADAAPLPNPVTHTTPQPAEAPAPPATETEAPVAASEPVHVLPKTSWPQEAVPVPIPDAPPLPEETVAPVAIPIPEGKWVCVGHANLRIEWDMKFSGSRAALQLSGNKLRVGKDRALAQAGERATILTLEGSLTGRKWSGRYREVNTRKPTAAAFEGNFEAEFSEDFEAFTGRIVTPDGKASSPFTGTAAR